MVYKSMSERAESPKLSVRYTVVLEMDGESVVDHVLVSILEGVQRHGSLLAASKSLGIPYSRAWETISRAERILGVKLVETRRGGVRRGGTKLTRHAEEILRLYREAMSRLEKCVGPQAPLVLARGEPDLVVAHSHDPLLNLALEKLRSYGYSIESVCIGSGLSFAMLSLGEAQVACAHLFDPDSGEYNKPYLQRYWVEDVVKIGGYKRQIVLAYRRELEYNSLDAILEDIILGKLRIVNRNRGSGTRILFDYLINKKSRELGVEKPAVHGYEHEVYTHSEAARIVAVGKADAALMLRSVAEEYGLKWVHVVWEDYECYTRLIYANQEPVTKLRELLSSDWFSELLTLKPGYKVATR